MDIRGVITKLDKQTVDSIAKWSLYAGLSGLATLWLTYVLATITSGSDAREIGQIIYSIGADVWVILLVTTIVSAVYSLRQIDSAKYHDQVLRLAGLALLIGFVNLVVGSWWLFQAALEALD